MSNTQGIRTTATDLPILESVTTEKPITIRISFQMEKKSMAFSAV